MLFAAGCLALGAVIFLSPIAPETVQMQARSLVRQKKYEPALVKYESIAEWMRKDPERIIEWARTCAYADRHAEAIALFEEVASKYPDRMTKISTELADARAFTALVHARQLVDKKQYDQAIKEYDSVAKWLERDPGLLIERARAYAYDDRHVDAISAFEAIAAKYPDQAESFAEELADQKVFVVLARARQLVEKKQYTEAIKEYDSIIKWLERDPGLLIERARVYTYADRQVEAIALLEAITAKYPERAGEVAKELADQKSFVALGRARQLVEKKQFAEAIKEYDGIAKWLERDPGLQIERARTYTYADRHDEAIALLEAITAKYPERAGEVAKELADQKSFVALARARQLVEKKQFAEAIKEYDGIAKWLERDPGLQIERARVYAYASRHTDAIALYEEIIKAHPDQKSVLEKELLEQGDFVELELARSLVVKKDYGRAIPLYEQITALLDRDPGLWIELARVYSYANNHVKTVEILERMRQQYPDYKPSFLRELGDAYAWQNKLDDAIRIYRLALEKTPDDPDAAAGLARTLGWTGKRIEALQIYDAALAKHPESARLLVGKADVLSMMDRFSEARRLLEGVMQKEPGNLDALNMKARLLVWDGYHRRGAGMYRKILEMAPDNPDALEGLAFALYWDEREAESVKVLERLLVFQPTRKEAAGLMYRVNRATNPDVTVLGEYFSDSDHRDVWRSGFSGGIIPTYGTRLEAQVDAASITSDSVAATNEVGAYGIGVSIDAHLGEQFRLKVPVRETHYDKNGWDAWTTDSSLQWQPVDTWFFEGGYEHAVIEKVATILDELAINNVKGKIKWKPDRLWMFSCAVNHGDYSDGNRQDAVMGIAEYRMTQNPYSKLYYNYYFSDWDEEAANYFSPARFSAHTLGLYLSSVITPSLFLEGQGSGGYETQVRRSGPDVNAPNIFFAGGLVYRPSESWRISLRGEYFESFSDSSGNYDGYRSVMGRLGITYLFGGGLEREQLSTETVPSQSPRNR